MVGGKTCHEVADGQDHTDSFQKVWSPPAAGPGPSASPGGGRKLKLSAVMDPTLDADVFVMERTEVQRLCTEYKARFGDFPSHESDPSLDQLSPLKQVMQAGAAPYTGFSVFGPHGLRFL